MTFQILAFGIARDILGGAISSLELPPEAAPTVGNLKRCLLEKHPRFAALASLRVAVNAEFADDDWPLQATDEIALIPPVSGG